MFGFPKECVHDNVVQSCQLSFSCWLQGGRHAEGCGNNKWLFSCCIQDKHEKREKHEKIESMTGTGMSTGDMAEVLPPTSYSRNKHIIKANYYYKNEIDLPLRVHVPKLRLRKVERTKPNMLRRRIDDDEPVSTGEQGRMDGRGGGAD